MLFRRVIRVVLLLPLVGCTDAHPDPVSLPTAPTTVTPSYPCPEDKPPVGRLRRLSDTEVDRVMRTISPEQTPSTGAFTPEPRVGGFDNNANALLVSDGKLEDYLTLARQAAETLTTPAQLARSPCPPDSQPGPCAIRFAEALSPRIFGRSLTDDERQRLQTVFRVGAESSTFRSGLATMLQAMFLSPYFLYRTELASEDHPGVFNATDIASRLSFMLTGQRPDAELSTHASELFDPAIRQAEALRLLRTEAGKTQLRYFVRSWLRLTNVAMLSKELGQHFAFTPAVRQAMSREIDVFIDHVITHKESRLDEIFLADYGFPGPALGETYGDDLMKPIGAFEQTPFNVERRRGILSYPGFLAAHAPIDLTSPVMRGAFVRGELFCQDISPPPLGLEIVPPAPDPTQTTRQRFSIHAASPGCASCHRYMDPIGFGFENFDAVGRYRTEENGLPIDATGELFETDVDGTFVGPGGLGQKLVQSRMFARCFVTQYVRFAEGSADVVGESCRIEHLTDVFIESGFRIDTLAATYASKDAFTHVGITP
jgi:Protein of unknown function (DUF1588)/Protein of unknown function (DUF1592)/Protein of unknown function (DUF1595)/Protein of unknown function (DUF1587)/Protein of unknown function (DUF1585)